jgi:hypothetical protein
MIKRKILHYIGLILAVLLLGSCLSQNGNRNTYSNPVIPGEIPDPTIFWVDGTFVAQWGYSPRVGFVMEGKENSTHRYSELRIAYSAK